MTTTTLVALFSATVFLAWLMFGRKIIHFFVKPRPSYTNKCMERVITAQIESIYTTIHRNLLLFTLLIPLAFLLPTLDFEQIIKALASKGVTSGNIFSGITITNVVAVPALVVIISLMVYVVKFVIVDKAVGCLENIDCNCG